MRCSSAIPFSEWTPDWRAQHEWQVNCVRPKATTPRTSSTTARGPECGQSLTFAKSRGRK
eukprot:6853266-Pyramimonas_sp.AAC.1